MTGNTWQIDEAAMAEVVKLIGELRTIGNAQTKQVTTLIAVVEQLQKRVAERDATIAELQAQLQERNADVVRKDAQIAELQAWIIAVPVKAICRRFKGNVLYRAEFEELSDWINKMTQP